MSEPYNLEKWIWTEEDFEQMSWYDCRIYALALPENAYEVVLDIDYIFQWIHPKESGEPYDLIISPATLVFENITDFKMDFGRLDFFLIDEIKRDNMSEPLNYDHVKKHQWLWEISCRRGDLEFNSIGYKQYIRQTPKRVKTLSLGLEARDGYSFFRGRTDV